jgi:alpha-aminoadipate carrier protein LysW
VSSVARLFKQLAKQKFWRLKMAVVCPECDNPIIIDADEVEEGETVQCDECGTALEVISVDPLELAPVDEAGYDDEDTPRIEEEEED